MNTPKQPPRQKQISKPGDSRRKLDYGAKVSKAENPYLKQLLDPMSTIAKPVCLARQPAICATFPQRIVVPVSCDTDGQALCIKVLPQLADPIQVQKSGSAGDAVTGWNSDFNLFKTGTSPVGPNTAPQGFLLPATTEQAEDFAFYGGWNVGGVSPTALRFQSNSPGFPTAQWSNGVNVMSDYDGWMSFGSAATGACQLNFSFTWDRSVTGDQIYVDQRTAGGVVSQVGSDTQVGSGAIYSGAFNFSFASAVAFRLRYGMGSSTGATRNLSGYALGLNQNAPGVLHSDITTYQWPDADLMVSEGKGILFNGLTGDLHYTSNELLKGGDVACGQRDSRFATDDGDFPAYATVAGNPLYHTHALENGARVYWAPGAASDFLFRAIGQEDPLVAQQELIFSCVMAKAGQTYMFTVDATISILTTTMALSPKYHRPQNALVDATLDVLSSVISHGSENDGHVSFYAKLSSAWEEVCKFSPALVQAAKVAATVIPMILAV